MKHSFINYIKKFFLLKYSNNGMKIKINIMKLEEEFVSRFMKQGNSEGQIMKAFEEAREILPMTETGIRRALRGYYLKQRAGDYVLNNPRDFRRRVKLRLEEKLERKIEGMRHDPAIRSIKVKRMKTPNYTKLCENCGSDLGIVTSYVSYVKILTGNAGDSERRYVNSERQQFIYYECRECGATFDR